MLPFVRPDLAHFTAYQPHPGDSSSAPQTVDRLDTNENPYDLPDALKQKLNGAGQTLESNRYPDGTHADLKAAIAEYVNESAVLEAAITPDQISVGNGSDELIRSLLIATCVAGAGSILVAKPTFSMYGILAQTLGVPVLSVDRCLSTFEVDLAAAARCLAQGCVRAVFMVHPNSPTGNPLTMAELDWLRSLPDQVLVVIDEAYFEFSQTTVVGELRQRSNWVVLRTFSKAFRLAAHRVGYAIAHPELAAVLEKVRLPYNLPAMTQAAAAIALAHRQELLTIVPMLLAEREKLTQGLEACPVLQVYPSAANFLFVRLNEAIREQGSSDAALEKLFTALRSRGSLVRKISGGLRITVGSPAENLRTLSRLQEILPTLL